MWPAIIAAAGAIGSTLLNNKASRDASNSAADANSANADFQREFAQNSLQWRVNDAKAAGLHPLAALGANLNAGIPSYVGSNHSNSSAYAELASLSADLIKSQIEKNEAEAAKSKSESLLNMGQSPVSNPAATHRLSQDDQTELIYGSGITGGAGQYQLVQRPGKGDVFQLVPSQAVADGIESDNFFNRALNSIDSLFTRNRSEVAKNLTDNGHRTGALKPSEVIVPYGLNSYKKVKKSEANARKFHFFQAHD